MAITTYAELVTAIQTYTADNSTATTAQIDDWIRLAEFRIFYGSGDPIMSRPLRHRLMETSTQLTVPTYQVGNTSAGTANVQIVTLPTTPSPGAGLAFTFTAGFTNTSAMTLSANGIVTGPFVKGANGDTLDPGDVQAGGLYAVYYDGSIYILMPGDAAMPLPTRFLGGRMCYLSGSIRKVPYINSDDSGALRLSVNGCYTVEGTALRFIGVAGGALVDFKYYRKPAPLITNLNDIFREAPNLWLYAALVEGGIFLQNDAMVQKWYTYFSGATQGYMNTDAATRDGTAQTFIQAYGVIV